MSHAQQVRAADDDRANGRAFNLAGYPPITQIVYVQLLANIAGTRADLVRIPREQIERLGGQLFRSPCTTSVSTWMSL